MTKGPTPRQVAREANIARIKELALEQLAVEGAAGLSLRAIARELNLVSSAIYRYYASRDELITDLVVDAYGDLADAIEAAVGGAEGAREGWIAACAALRSWAVRAPHRYALIYGSAIPGYVAPAGTIAPAARVISALVAPVVAAGAARGSSSGASPGVVLEGRLREQVEATADALGLDVEPALMLSLVAAFARLQGLLGLELNGHLVGGFEPADDLYDLLVLEEADRWQLA